MASIKHCNTVFPSRGTLTVQQYNNKQCRITLSCLSMYRTGSSLAYTRYNEVTSYYVFLAEESKRQLANK